MNIVLQTTCWITILLYCFSIAPLSAQPEQEQRKLRLAQSYEQNGDLRNAARLYQELYETNKQQYEYFNGVARTLLGLGSPAGLLPLIEEQLLLKHPEQRLVELYALKGDVLWKTGKTVPAGETWNKGLSIAPKRDSTYVKIAKSQVQNRAFEAAVNTLLKARSELQMPTLFADDLCQLYATVGNYTAGTSEILLLLRLQGFNVALGRISAYTINEKGIQQTRAALEKAASSEPGNILLQRLYGQFLRDIKDYERSLELIIRIDNLLNAQGREILQFAELSRRERMYGYAIKAYGLILDKGKKNPFALSASLGYARAMEQRLLDSASLPEQELYTVLERYAHIVRDFPQTPTAAEAQLRIGLLTRDYLHKPREAVESFAVLLQRYAAYPVAAQGAVDLGNTYIQLGQLDKAKETFSRVPLLFPLQTTEKDEALFHLAELEYFRCVFDSAQIHCSALAVNTNADIANDALEMLSALEYQQAPGGKESLCSMAQADLSSRQQKPDVAIERYKAIPTNIAANARIAPLAELALLKAGKLERAHKRCEQAQQTFALLLDKYPETGLGDQALMMQADCLVESGKKDLAMGLYNQILVKYPRSMFLQEVRVKIRKLRGDA